MKILFNKIFLDHNIDSQYEGGYRLKDFKDIKDTTIDGEKWITLVHPETYRDTIKNACLNREVIAEVQLTPESYKAICIAVGLSVEASETENFAVVRPPGHHASFEKPSGFCLFNNIAIATQKLLNEGKRVLLLDIDGHHGDGTQNIFYNTDKVLFCSIHQEYAYPFTGFATETGAGEGIGYTMNFPLMSDKGDKEFLKRIDKVIEQGREFKPDVIGISAGFDGYFKDKLLQLNYSQRVFYECTYRLKKNFRRTPVFAVLEGGYHPDLRKLVDLFVEGINKGKRPPKITFNEEMAIG